MAMASARASLTTMTTFENDFWRDIPGFEGLYQVNRNGEILSLRSGQLRKPTRSGNGYRKVSLSNANHEKIQRNAHRIVAEAFCKKPSNDAIEVNHINLDKTDNRAVNLEWVTPDYNFKHAYNGGRINYKRPTRADNSTGHKGVSKHGRKWQAYITFSGNRKYLGLFTTYEDAVAAREKAEAEYEEK